MPPWRCVQCGSDRETGSELACVDLQALSWPGHKVRVAQGQLTRFSEASWCLEADDIAKDFFPYLECGLGVSSRIKRAYNNPARWLSKRTCIKCIITHSQITHAGKRFCSTGIHGEVLKVL